MKAIIVEPKDIKVLFDKLELIKLRENTDWVSYVATTKEVFRYSYGQFYAEVKQWFDEQGYDGPGF